MSFPFEVHDVVIAWNEGLLEFDYRRIAHLDADQATTILQRSLRELQARDVVLPTSILIRMGKTRLSRDAREVFASSEANTALTNRAALLADNPLAVAVGNFFLGLNRPKHPTRLFTDETAAIAWLKADD